MDSVNKNPPCLKCSHFRVTWETAFPRSCTLFGIKCRGIPAEVVRQNTGKICPAYEESRCGRNKG